MIKLQPEAAQLALKNWGANFMCQPGSNVESKAPELGLIEVVELVGLGALLSNQ